MANYKIIISGISATGQEDLDKIRQTLTDSYQVSDQDLQDILDENEFILKDDLPYSEADSIAEQLTEMGLTIDIRPAAPEDELTGDEIEEIETDLDIGIIEEELDMDQDLDLGDMELLSDELPDLPEMPEDLPDADLFESEPLDEVEAESKDAGRQPEQPTIPDLDLPDPKLFTKDLLDVDISDSESEEPEPDFAELIGSSDFAFEQIEEPPESAPAEESFESVPDEEPLESVTEEEPSESAPDEELELPDFNFLDESEDVAPKDFEFPELDLGPSEEIEEVKQESEETDFDFPDKDLGEDSEEGHDIPTPESDPFQAAGDLETFEIGVDEDFPPLEEIPEVEDFEDISSDTGEKGELNLEEPDILMQETFDPSLLDSKDEEVAAESPEEIPYKAPEPEYTGIKDTEVASLEEELSNLLGDDQPSQAGDMEGATDFNTLFPGEDSDSVFDSGREEFDEDAPHPLHKPIPKEILEEEEFGFGPEMAQPKKTKSRKWVVVNVIVLCLILTAGIVLYTQRDKIIKPKEQAVEIAPKPERAILFFTKLNVGDVTFQSPKDWTVLRSNDDPGAAFAVFPPDEIVLGYMVSGNSKDVKEFTKAKTDEGLAKTFIDNNLEDRGRDYKKFVMEVTLPEEDTADPSLIFKGQADNTNIEGMVQAKDDTLVFIYLQAKDIKFNDYKYVYSSVINSGYKIAKKTVSEKVAEEAPEVETAQPATKPATTRTTASRTKIDSVYRVKVLLKNGDVVTGVLTYEDEDEYEIKLGGASRPVFIEKRDVISIKRYNQTDQDLDKKTPKPTTIDEKRDLIGKRVRIDMHNGERFFGLIEKAYENSYQVRIFRSYGELVINMKDSEIKRIQRARY